ncbi:MAG TPA: hypothetical protein DDW50_20730 [Firmicutes bacterium]|jgi:hypothetical protein|nr:hypothetical protein [Bacillota bacterium]
MAYCSECGIYYTGKEDICPSCGNGTRNRKPETEPLINAGNVIPLTQDFIVPTFKNEAEGNSDFKNEQEIPPSTVFERSGRDQSLSNNEKAKMNSSAPQSEVIYFQNESQLGKGIIKPQKIEMATDGVHFKYETPTHSFMKEGPVKEKPKEYRVTFDDMELKTLNEISLEKISQELPTPPTLMQDEIIEKPSEEKTDEETLIENEGKPKESLLEEFNEPDVLQADVESKIIEEPISELISEPVFPEPELSEPNDNIAYEDVAVWEGTQSWLKIPIGNRYRVTRSSLIIFDKNHYKLFDVALSLISEISVKQSWIDKLLGIGDLLVSIPEFAATKVVLGGISEPYKVKTMIEQLIKDE